VAYGTFPLAGSYLINNSVAVARLSEDVCIYAGGVVGRPILSMPLVGMGYKIEAPDSYREGAR